MKKRKAVWMLLIVVSMLVTIVAGCSQGSGGSGGAGDSGGDSGSGEKVKLRFIRWSNGPALDKEEQDKIKRFNESHPNIEVQMTLLPWDETFRKIELSLASNDPIDLFYWDVPAYAWYKKGLFKNLQPYFDRDLNMEEYNAELFEPFKFDGKNMYVAPENYQTLTLYYNKTAFDNAGLDYPNADWTWEDVLEAAKKLTIREGNRVTQYGFDATAMGTWWAWMSLSAAQGGKLVEDVHEPTKITLNTPETTAALQFLQDMIYKHKVSPDVATKDSMGLNFQTGKIAMYVGGDWDLGTLREITDFEWDMAPLPKWGEGRATPYFMGGYVMAENTKHPEEAWEFIKWTMTENQKTLANQHSWIAVHNPSREAAEIPDWVPSGYKEARFEWMKDGMIGDIYSIKWREAYDKYMVPMQDEIFINGGSVPDALAKTEREINALLQSK
ncbi:ABC transporter substrate-binding protein [Paenibacillus sp. 32O-W]|jgi:ABC-type sugar transport system, periplasmic component|uniref:ABC transporter substrate-binding protein n=1 Tax=Paenibacillus sp. 32O-W TaxID=1695218 RepID=UPI00071FD89A|nr:sugar ABC transporter substrate-binding protein [Paenibacillus sp. 32O-W]ALS29851.1 ABC transporter substrate-binding protein [Paenibacillus sp. 32O-W]